MTRSRYLLPVLLIALALTLLVSLPSAADERVSPEKINKLIEQMGSGTFAEREKATADLDAIGVPALEALRKAAKSADAEVRKRAEELVKKIAKQAENAKILAAKRVHLVCKDTPLSEALADLQKQSGYNLYLHDPEGKLKERRLSLDTGETRFWHALDLFCAKAGLTEAMPLEVMNPPVRRNAGGGPAPLRAGKLIVPGQILLKDGKSPKLPTDDRGAVRFRAMPKAEGIAPEREILLALEVTPEPKLQWQGFQSIRMERAVDDRDQKLTQVTPQVAAGPGGFAPPGGVPRPARAPFVGQWGGSPSQRLPVQLKKGEKAAKSLKELTGVLTANVLTEATPMITADNLAKAVGKTFKGDEGGFLKILDVKRDEKKTTIQLEFEQPPNTFAPMPGPAMPPVGIRLQPAPAVPPPPPPPPAAQAPVGPPVKANQFQVQGKVQGGGGGVIVMRGAAPTVLGPVNGLSVQDDKGNALPVHMGPMQIRMMQQPGGGNLVVATYTLVCVPGKDQGVPVKVVYLGRKSVTLDIPFTLREVPLP